MVDNGSNDGSIGYVESNYQWVKILSLDKNYGFAEANNIGVKMLKGNMFVF